MGISWQNNSINYLDFLRAVEDSKPSGPEPRESEPGAPVNFAKLSPEEVLKGVQKVVAACGPALATVRQTALCGTDARGCVPIMKKGCEPFPPGPLPPLHAPGCRISEEWLRSCAQ